MGQDMILELSGEKECLAALRAFVTPGLHPMLNGVRLNVLSTAKQSFTNWATVLFLCEGVIDEMALQFCGGIKNVLAQLALQVHSFREYMSCNVELDLHLGCKVLLAFYTLVGFPCPMSQQVYVQFFTGFKFHSAFWTTVGVVLRFLNDGGTKELALQGSLDAVETHEARVIAAIQLRNHIRSGTEGLTTDITWV